MNGKLLHKECQCEEESCNTRGYQYGDGDDSGEDTYSKDLPSMTRGDGCG